MEESHILQLYYFVFNNKIKIKKVSKTDIEK